MWNGTYDVCQEANFQNGYFNVKKLDESDENACDGGDIIDAIAPINMTIDSGMISCGKRGGPTFLETVRVDPMTKECPRGLVPCNYNSPADETVCVKEYE